MLKKKKCMKLWKNWKSEKINDIISLCTMKIRQKIRKDRIVPLLCLHFKSFVNILTSSKIGKYTIANLTTGILQENLQEESREIHCLWRKMRIYWKEKSQSVTQMTFLWPLSSDLFVGILHINDNLSTPQHANVLPSIIPNKWKEIHPPYFLSLFVSVMNSL